MVTIAQISDVHLPPLPPFGGGEISIKRSLGYLSWHRKRKAVHRQEVLEALVADLQGCAPDHIHVSGDLTNLALEAEYKRSRGFLEQLGSPDDVSVIPGNHDHYCRDMHAAIRTHWDGYALGGADAAFPVMRVVGQVALIGVNSAVRTAPFMANGRVDDEQLERLGAVLHATKAEGLTRIVSIHHSPQDDACSWRRGLFARAAFQDIIAQHGADLIVHGHLHKVLKGEIAGVPVRGAGSCSAYPRAHYHVLHCDAQGLRIEHRIYNQGQAAFTAGETEIL